MNREPSPIPGVERIRRDVHRDGRGAFSELWRTEWLADVSPQGFVQDNISRSHRGVIRGLHFQHPNGQGKLVTVLTGAGYDVAVDVRVGSPTFGQWYGATLTSSDFDQLWIPPGFAHGFQALEDDTLLHYKCTTPYHAASERSALATDPALGIPWPVQAVVLSPKDAAARPLGEFADGELPRFG